MIHQNFITKSSHKCFSIFCTQLTTIAVDTRIELQSFVDRNRTNEFSFTHEHSIFHLFSKKYLTSSNCEFFFVFFDKWFVHFSFLRASITFSFVRSSTRFIVIKSSISIICVHVNDCLYSTFIRHIFFSISYHQRYVFRSEKFSFSTWQKFRKFDMNKISFCNRRFEILFLFSHHENRVRKNERNFFICFFCKNVRFWWFKSISLNYAFT